jgi:hypothetical protein
MAGEGRPKLGFNMLSIEKARDLAVVGRGEERMESEAANSSVGVEGGEDRRLGDDEDEKEGAGEAGRPPTPDEMTAVMLSGAPTRSKQNWWKAEEGIMAPVYLNSIEYQPTADAGVVQSSAFSTQLINLPPIGGGGGR